MERESFSYQDYRKQINDKDFHMLSALKFAPPMVDQVGRVILTILAIPHNEENSWQLFKKNFDDIYNKMTTEKPYEVSPEIKEESIKKIEKIEGFGVEKAKKISLNLVCMLKMIEKPINKKQN